MPTRISREDLYRRITNGDRPILVEALGAGYYADAHLPGAINIPPGHVDRLAATLLPDPQAPIVVYCTGRARAATPSPDGSRSSATQRWPSTPAARRTGSNTASPSNGSTPTDDSRRTAQDVRKVHHRPAPMTTRRSVTRRIGMLVVLIGTRVRDQPPLP